MPYTLSVASTVFVAGVLVAFLQRVTTSPLDPCPQAHPRSRLEARIIQSKAAHLAAAAIDSTDRTGKSVSGGSYMLCETGLRLDSSPALPGLTIAIGAAYDPGIAIEPVLFGATPKRIELLTAIDSGQLAFRIDFDAWNRLVRSLSLARLKDSLQAVAYACEVISRIDIHSYRRHVDCTTEPLLLAFRSSSNTWYADIGGGDSLTFTANRQVLWPTTASP